MKQYKITSADILQDSQEDCYLDPNDPVHELKIAGYLGGLGADARLEQYRVNKQLSQTAEIVNVKKNPRSHV
jgi:hypothetical protein